MARRVGGETVEHWSRGVEEYGKPRTNQLIKRYEGSWVEFKSTDEGVGGNANVATVLSALWIPDEVELLDADDYFVWTRRPDEKYRTSGDVGRHYDRRGNLRASVIPVDVRS